MINQQAIRAAMQAVNKQAQIGIMIGKSSVSLMWRAGSHWHSKSIEKQDCTVDSRVFNEILADAKVSLYY